MTRHMLWIGSMLAITGCAGPATRTDLDAASFVRAGEQPAPQPELAGPPAPVISVTQLTEVERIADASATAGPPEIDPNAPTVASPVLVDELVGEVNGQPIFANDFLSSLGSRIAQVPQSFEEENGRPPSRNEWDQAAFDIIRNELMRVVRDELVGAESYRNLDVPEANFRRFLEAVRNNEISLRGGSAAAAERSIQDETGLSIDELEEMRGDQVVMAQYLRQFHAGISVSPRDIERYYKSNPEEFNPPPTIRFWWIWLRADDLEAVLRIGDELAETAPEDVPEAFMRLAGDEANRFSPSTGGMREMAFQGDLKAQQFVRSELLNDALVNLDHGSFAGPIEHDNSVSWVFLESVTQESISLYDAQVMIEEKLRLAEFDRRLEAEVLRLHQESGVTIDLMNEISLRLLKIAKDRYQ